LPRIVATRVQDVGLRTKPDSVILRWAAENDYIIVTPDGSTMPGFAYDRVLAGLAMPGVFVVPLTMSVGEAIEELRLIDECSTHEEWAGKVAHLPL
jgi:hypothetical protein